ncbi:hypothetical protein [uncultured Thiodictyon sp.]|jgi:hypothetical protein|uniref:hypothetical protein n=1 Tax=uncultured Thiodictyon sp. TaxID=1846217 RepID=UPI0025E0C4B4|nr:hypothetical protein [uncultured Thiodictyon sp.]
MASLAPLLALVGIAVAQPLWAEQGTAKILAPWEANGQVFQVAVDKLQFIGTFAGIMYIEHGQGLLDAALFTCPSTQITEILANTIKGHGYCTIESPTGDYIYAEYNCDGEPGSCTGTFKLTGGTGKLTGITGESDLIVRTALSGTTIDQAGGGTVSAAKGLAIWPEMHFEIPGKSAEALNMLGTGAGAAAAKTPQFQPKPPPKPVEEPKPTGPAKPGAPLEPTRK